MASERNCDSILGKFESTEGERPQEPLIRLRKKSKRTRITRKSEKVSDKITEKNTEFLGKISLINTQSKQSSDLTTRNYDFNCQMPVEKSGNSSEKSENLETSTCQNCEEIFDKTFCTEDSRISCQKCKVTIGLSEDKTGISSQMSTETKDIRGVGARLQEIREEITCPNCDKTFKKDIKSSGGLCRKNCETKDNRGVRAQESKEIRENKEETTCQKCHKVFVKTFTSKTFEREHSRKCSCQICDESFGKSFTTQRPLEIRKPKRTRRSVKKGNIVIKEESFRENENVFVNEIKSEKTFIKENSRKQERITDLMLESTRSSVKDVRNSDQKRPQKGQKTCEKMEEYSCQKCCKTFEKSICCKTVEQITLTKSEDFKKKVKRSRLKRNKKRKKPRVEKCSEMRDVDSIPKITICHAN